MQRRDGQLRYSASDLMAFLECQHITTLELLNLETPLTRSKPDEQVELIQDKGFAHEAGYLTSLESGGVQVVKLTSEGDAAKNLAATLLAMQQGADVIFQAALSDGAFFGYADFLRRVEKQSKYGNWSYEVADTKLAQRAKPKFLVQLAHYSELLGASQGVAPERMHLVLGNRDERSFRRSDYVYYYRRLRLRFERFLASRPVTKPERCDHCSLCDWRERCAGEWLATDHLNQVANITKIQIKRLKDAGVMSLASLGEMPESTSVPKVSPETLSRLRSQASLQLKKRQTGQNQLELLPRSDSHPSGFDLLPEPDPGDLYFDMEGDPLYEGGLEYLFGVYFQRDGKWVFRDFWAHDRNEEKSAFVEFIDFVTAHLAVNPKAHIYHYAHYEPTALKRLMSLHGIREANVDQLLYDKRFVDLYQVVRYAIRVSEPAYSIKNLETFYMRKREGDVTSAGASVVYYEKWRQSGDDDLLAKIRDYNKDDCISTQLLHSWLMGLKPQATKYSEGFFGQERSVKSEKTIEHEQRIEHYRQLLLNGVPESHSEQSAEQRLAVLVFQMLDFFRRSDKPAWWELFARSEMSTDELMEDAECIAGMSLVSVVPPEKGKGMGTGTYAYPEQEFKLAEAKQCLRTDTSQRLGTIETIDEEKRTIQIKFGKIEEIPEFVSICGSGPLSRDKIREAVFRIADSLIAGDDKYRAALGFLRKTKPRLKGLSEGDPIVRSSKDVVEQAIEAVANLDDSHLFIQGPPGAGKTYTGSRIIVELLKRGYRVGVTSNSHKAVHNLLHAVEARAEEAGIEIAGRYKASSQTKGSDFDGRFIETVQKNDEVYEGLSAEGAYIAAGTAWLFSDEMFDQTLDYLFIDEAGQVAAAHLAGMATSARNIVLLGDQMQLGQPIQGVHPGESGLSALDFLLGDRATIPPDEGIFLETTWRMHPDVCRFISDAIYESRLLPEKKNSQQRLLLNEAAYPALKPTGLVYLPVEHDTCSQSSAEEAAVVVEVFKSLLDQHYRDRDGEEWPINVENILVVAPYNIQVNLLKRLLPVGARVGTVDKFQGQEAEVVIVSMTTSNADTMPRHIDFLYSKNRLNVAISRARCLAVLVANPALAEIRCSTVEQMSLVNLMCKATEPEERH